jgi:hypothetical protein
MRYIALVPLAGALMLPAPAARADDPAPPTFIPVPLSDANVQPVYIADRSNASAMVFASGLAGGLAVGFAVGYAVRATVSLRHRQAAMKRRHLL